MRGFVIAITATVLMGISATGTAASARHGHPGGPKCLPAHWVVLAADAQAVVYRAPFSVEMLPRYIFGCANGSRRSFRLGPLPYGGPSGSGGVLPIALAGPVVAYGVGESYTSGHSFSEIWVRNLASGRVIHRMPNGSPAEHGDVGLGETTAIVVRRDGAVAWIARASAKLGSIQVRAVDRTGSHLLAASPEIEPKSLALVGGGLRWTEGGRRFSASLE
jgi:hypothetical protein